MGAAWRLKPAALSIATMGDETDRPLQISAVPEFADSMADVSIIWKYMWYFGTLSPLNKPILPLYGLGWLAQNRLDRPSADDPRQSILLGRTISPCR
jgi:hypothetical protein